MFQLRIEAQSRVQEMDRDLSRQEVEDLLCAQIREWLASPRTILQLTCGDVRLAVTAGETPAGWTPAAPQRQSSGESADEVTSGSEQSFPASDPPASSAASATPEP